MRTLFSLYFLLSSPTGVEVTPAGAALEESSVGCAGLPACGSSGAPYIHLQPRVGALPPPAPDVGQPASSPSTVELEENPPNQYTRSHINSRLRFNSHEEVALFEVCSGNLRRKRVPRGATLRDLEYFLLQKNEGRRFPVFLLYDSVKETWETVNDKSMKLSFGMSLPPEEENENENASQTAPAAIISSRGGVENESLSWSRTLYQERDGEWSRLKQPPAQLSDGPRGAAEPGLLERNKIMVESLRKAGLPYCGVSSAENENAGVRLGHGENAAAGAPTVPETGARGTTSGGTGSPRPVDATTACASSPSPRQEPTTEERHDEEPEVQRHGEARGPVTTNAAFSVEKKELASKSKSSTASTKSTGIGSGTPPGHTNTEVSAASSGSLLNLDNVASFRRATSCGGDSSCSSELKEKEYRGGSSAASTVCSRAGRRRLSSSAFGSEGSSGTWDSLPSMARSRGSASSLSGAARTLTDNSMSLASLHSGSSGDETGRAFSKNGSEAGGSSVASFSHISRPLQHAIPPRPEAGDPGPASSEADCRTLPVPARRERKVPPLLPRVPSKLKTSGEASAGTGTPEAVAVRAAPQEERAVDEDFLASTMGADLTDLSEQEQEGVMGVDAQPNLRELTRRLRQFQLRPAADDRKPGTTDRGFSEECPQICSEEPVAGKQGEGEKKDGGEVQLHGGRGRNPERCFPGATRVTTRGSLQVLDEETERTTNASEQGLGATTPLACPSDMGPDLFYNKTGAASTELLSKAKVETTESEEHCHGLQHSLDFMMGAAEDELSLRDVSNSPTRRRTRTGTHRCRGLGEETEAVTAFSRRNKKEGFHYSNTTIGGEEEDDTLCERHSMSIGGREEDALCERHSIPPRRSSRLGSRFGIPTEDSQEPLIRLGRGSVSCINPSRPSEHKVEDMVSNLQMPAAAPEATAVSNSKLPPAGSGVNSTTSSALMYFPPSEAGGLSAANSSAFRSNVLAGPLMQGSPARRERTRMAEMPFSPVGARKESKKKVFYWGVLWKEVPTNWHVFAHRFANFGELFSTSADLQGEAALMMDHGRSSQTQLQARAAVASRGTAGRSRSDGGGRGALASSSARSRLFELYRDGHDAFSFPLPFVRNGAHPTAAHASTRPANPPSQSPSLGRISSVAASTIELSKFRCAHQLRLTGTVRLACAPFLLAQLFTGLDYIWPAAPRPARRLFRPPAPLPRGAIPSTSLYVPLPDMTAADSSEEQEGSTVRQGSDNEWSSEGKSDSDIAVEAASSRGVELVDTGRAEREVIQAKSSATVASIVAEKIHPDWSSASLAAAAAAGGAAPSAPEQRNETVCGHPYTKGGADLADVIVRQVFASHGDSPVPSEDNQPGKPGGIEIDTPIFDEGEGSPELERQASRSPPSGSGGSVTSVTSFSVQVSDGSNSTPSKEISRSLLKRTTDAALYTCRAAARVSKALPRVGSSSLASGFCKKGDAPSSRRGLFSRGGKRVAPEPDASGNLTPETSSDSKLKGGKPSSSASGLQLDPIIPAAQPPTLAQGGLNPEPGELDAAADELLRRLHALSLDNADAEHSVAGETAAQAGLPAGFGLTSANSVRAPLQGDFPDDHMTRRQNKTSTTPDDCSIDATLGDPIRSPSRQDSLKSKDSSSSVSLAEGGEPPLPVALPGVPLSPPEQSRLSTGDDPPEEQGEMVAPPGDEGPTPRVVAGTAAGDPVQRDGADPADGRFCDHTKKKKKKADLRAPLEYQEFPVRRFATLYAGWVLESLGPSGAFLEMLAEIHHGAQRAFGRVQRQPREPPYHLLGYREEGLDFLDPPGMMMHHRDYAGWIDDELPSDQMMRHQPPARSTGSAGPLPSSAASVTFPPTKSAANYFSATPAPASFVSRSSWELPPQQSFVRDVGASYWRRSLEKYEGFRREVDKWTWSVFNLRHARVAAKALHADELVPTERDLATERQREVDAAATAAGGVGVPPDGAAAGVFHRDPMRPARGFHEDEGADATGRPAAVVARAAERPRDEAAAGGGTAEDQEAAMPDGGGDGIGNGDGRVYQPGLGKWTTPAGDQAQPAKNPLAHTLQAGGEALKDWAKRVWTADRELAQVLFDGCKEERRTSSNGAASRVDNLLEMLGVDEDDRDFLAARAAAILADDSDNEDDAAIYRDRLLYEDPGAADLAPPPQYPLFNDALWQAQGRAPPPPPLLPGGNNVNAQAQGQAPPPLPLLPGGNNVVAREQELQARREHARQEARREQELNDEFDRLVALADDDDDGSSAEEPAAPAPLHRPHRNALLNQLAWEREQQQQPPIDAPERDGPLVPGIRRRLRRLAAREEVEEAFPFAELAEHVELADAAVIVAEDNLPPNLGNPNLFGRNLDEEEDRGGPLGAGNREAGTEPTGNRPQRQESRRTTPTSSFGGGRAKSKGSRFSSEGEPSVDFSECRLRRHLFPEGPLEPHFTTHARPPERPGDPDPAEYREGLLPMRGPRGQRFLFDADFFEGSSGAQGVQQDAGPGVRAGAGRARGFTREADLDDRTELREVDLRFHVIQPFFGVDVVTHRINMRWQVLMTLGEGRRATPPFPAGGKVMRLELNIHHYVTRSDIRLRLRPDRAPDYVISLGANEPVSLMFY